MCVKFCRKQDNSRKLCSDWTLHQKATSVNLGLWQAFQSQSFGYSMISKNGRMQSSADLYLSINWVWQTKLHVLVANWTLHHMRKCLGITICKRKHLYQFVINRPGVAGAVLQTVLVQLNMARLQNAAQQTSYQLSRCQNVLTIWPLWSIFFL